jgi:putative zinc finger/helix-turn-helix YgiT family protein
MIDDDAREGWAEPRSCALCGAAAAKRSIEEQKFRYGSEADAVELSALVPVWTCGECGFAFTDGEAEEARHEAVCRHFGLLTPAEILGVRQAHRMSQAEFAKATGFGIASIKRWENGLSLQNPAADRMLRLLRSDPGIMRKLLELSSETTAA